MLFSTQVRSTHSRCYLFIADINKLCCFQICVPNANWLWWNASWKSTSLHNSVPWVTNELVKNQLAAACIHRINQRQIKLLCVQNSGIASFFLVFFVLFQLHNQPFTTVKYFFILMPFMTIYTIYAKWRHQWKFIKKRKTEWISASCSSYQQTDVHCVVRVFLLASLEYIQ